MQKRLILSACIIMLFFYACSKKSNPQPNSTPTLISKWYLNKIITVQYSSSGASTITDNVSYDPENYFQFTNSTNGTVANNGSTVNFSYTLTGSVLQLVSYNSVEIDTVSSLSQTALILHTQMATGIANGIPYKYNLYEYFSNQK